MKALVTGGHGFIGSFLVEKLLHEGFSVRCLVRKTSNLKWIKDLPVELIYGDITQEESLRQAVHDIDYIYHSAAALKGLTKDNFFSVNTLGTQYLAKAASQYAPHLKRFVFISSMAAVGPALGTEKLKEDSLCQPISLYGSSKLEAEKMLKEKFSNLALTIIRPPMVYGPRDENFAAFFKVARKGIFPFFAPFERYYSIVHVKDLVEGIYAASLASNTLGKTYFICNPEIYTYESMAHHMTKPFSRTPHFIYVPQAAIWLLTRLGDIYVRITKKDILFTSKKFPEIIASSWICSPEKAFHDFNFRTQIPLSQGMQETIAWWKAYHHC